MKINSRTITLLQTIRLTMFKVKVYADLVKINRFTSVF